MLKIKACSIVVFLNVGHSYLPRIFFLRQRPSYLFSFFPPDLPRIWRYDWITFSSVQSLSCVRLFVTPWSAACQASSSITNCQSLPKPISIESVMPSNYFILCRPLLLSPSIFPSIRVFSNESALHIRWPDYWSFSFSISPSSEYSGLISFRMDWFDLLAVQETLESSLKPQFKSISSLVLSVLYGPTLTPIHDYWKSHSFD